MWARRSFLPKTPPAALISSMATSADRVGEVSNAAIQPLNDVAAPISTSLTSAGAWITAALVRMRAADSIFQSTFIMAYSFKADRWLDWHRLTQRTLGRAVAAWPC